MSGGVDSSLSAALLTEQGFDVTGVFMKVWSEGDLGGAVTPPGKHPWGVADVLSFIDGCPWEQDLADARAVAEQLGIELIVKNVQRQYWDKVVAEFLAGYQAGRTPNPDVLCNSQVKFGLLYDWAIDEGFEYIATGHYAQIVRGDHPENEVRGKGLGVRGDDPSRLASAEADASRLTPHSSLVRGVDAKKDQTYFLWQIDGQKLEHILFPIGHLTKPQVREEAAKRGLATATKKDSQGICFLGPLKVRQWLAETLETKPGTVVALDGTVIGTHRGAHLYTLGQRHGFTVDRDTRPRRINPPRSPFAKGEDAPLFRKEGLGEISSNSERPPHYVVKRDIERNELVVAPEPPQQRELHATDLNWLAEPPKAGDQVEARIRHGQTPQPAVVAEVTEQNLLLEFAEPQIGIAPGQSVVLTLDDLVLGGGIIS